MVIVSKFLCCLHLKVGPVVIGVSYLLMGFIFCITVELDYVKEAKVEGFGFMKIVLKFYCLFQEEMKLITLLSWLLLSSR